MFIYYFDIENNMLLNILDFFLVILVLEFSYSKSYVKLLSILICCLDRIFCNY